MRRRELLEAGALALASLVVPRRAGAAEPELLVHGEQPDNLATPLEYLDRLITPAEVFFVRSHFGPPALDRRRPLVIEGAKKKLELTADRLKRYREVSTVALLQCAGNGRALHVPRMPGVQWVHGGIGQAKWTGVRLVDLLEDAGVPTGAAHVRIFGADRPPKPKVPPFVRSIPLARAVDPTTIVAHRMNDAPLALRHGAPFRLVVPGWTGNHWMKWLAGVRPQVEEEGGFFMQTGYRYPSAPLAPGEVMKASVPVTTLALRSLIARPEAGARVRGDVEVAGIAVPGEAPVAAVEVSSDGGATWVRAALEGEPGVGRWNVFRHRFTVAPGRRRLVARAIDAAGRVQTKEAAWNPSGYLWSAWHEVEVEVTA